MIRRLVILGASGDLTARYLVPALAALLARGDLPDGFTIIGVARTDWDSARFRRAMDIALTEHAPHLDAVVREAVTNTMTYHRGDATSVLDLRTALQPADEPTVVYLALSPAIVGATLRALIDATLPDGSRVVVEKPFGESLRSAQELNELLHQALPESALFRIDHFLAEQAVQNLLGLRFANRMLEPLWGREHIERVEIVWDETLTLEGRAGYYDSAGALRDMIQSHLLQVLCFIAMEPPSSLNERDLRDRKVDLLRAVRRLTPDEVGRDTVRARYTRGQIGGRSVPSYVQEKGVDPARGTETFAQVELPIDNDRWAGVPFLLRSGKALRSDRFEIAVHFRAPAHLPFDGSGTAVGNVLRLRFEPADVTFSLTTNATGDLGALHALDVTGSLPALDLPPYARLLLDILRGENGLSIRDDEAEESWRIVEPILDAWSTGRSPLREYPAGKHFS